MSEITRVAIVDDDLKAIELLSGYLSRYPDMKVVATASTGSDAEAVVQEYCPQLLFLDIELPDANGMVLIRKVKALSPLTYIVMFTAVYNQYADGAFTRNENDYLLKPVDSMELDKVIQRFRCHCADLLPGKPCDDPDRLAVTTVTSEIRLLHVSEVGYFRYSTHRKIWEVVVSDGTIVTLKKNTSAATILGYNANFIQTHQSYIVNIENVMLIGQNRLSLYPPFSDDEVLVGRTFRKNLQEKFIQI